MELQAYESCYTTANMKRESIDDSSCFAAIIMSKSGIDVMGKTIIYNTALSVSCQQSDQLPAWQTRKKKYFLSFEKKVLLDCVEGFNIESVLEIFFISVIFMVSFI